MRPTSAGVGVAAKGGGIPPAAANGSPVLKVLETSAALEPSGSPVSSPAAKSSEQEMAHGRLALASMSLLVLQGTALVRSSCVQVLLLCR